MNVSQKTNFAYTVLCVVFGVIIILACILSLHGSKNRRDEQRTASETSAKQATNETLPLSVQLKTQTGDLVSVRVAATDEERELGLSYFKSLPQDQGMFFTFPKLGIDPFWMKGMNFPLDIIWLRKTSETSYQIVYEAQNVSPDTYPNTITPNREADTVLEVNAGVSKSLGMAVGTSVMVVK